MDDLCHSISLNFFGGHKYSKSQVGSKHCTERTDFVQNISFLLLTFCTTNVLFGPVLW